MKSILVVLMAFVLAGCTKGEVAQGHEGVWVKKPWFFGKGGVEPKAVNTGLEWGAASSDLFQVDMRPRRFSEKFQDVITSDNVPVDFSAYLILKVKTGESPILLSKFGNNIDSMYRQNIEEVFRTAVRKSAKIHTMTALTTGRVDTKSGMDPMDMISMDATEKIITLIKEKELPVVVDNVIISKAIPPKGVLEAISETAAQQQRKKTEKERSSAEIARKDAETNRAIADNAYRKGMGLSPSVYAELLKAELCAKATTCTMVLGSVPVAIATK